MFGAAASLAMLLFFLSISARLALAEAGRERSGTIRVAVFHANLSRAGPGLLLRDLLARAPPPDITRAAEIIRSADPDILLLQGFDYDAGLVALGAFNRLIGGGGPAYPQTFALRPNTGWQSGLDLDGDGRLGGARDAFGYGRFAGEGGMAVLSRLKLGLVRDLSRLLWRDLPGADLLAEGRLVLSDQALAALPLSTTAHWHLSADLPSGRALQLFAFHATPPGFDGSEDRNGRRARDEHRLWQAYLDGKFTQDVDKKVKKVASPLPQYADFVLLGTGNLDPDRGEGGAYMADFLADPRWQDPPKLRGKPTAFWPKPLGPLRVSYILPSTGLMILESGLTPETPDETAKVVPSEIAAKSDRKPRKAGAEPLAPLVRHLVWVDLRLE